MAEGTLDFERGGFEADRAEMNMTPMIDVVFLLIIFFMAAYQLSEAQTSADVELPAASNAFRKERNSPDTIVIEVVSGGEITQPYYRIGGRVFLPANWESEKPDPRAGSWQDLTALLRTAAAQADALHEPPPPVALHGDRRVPYKYIQHLMQLCAQLGITQFAFEARQPPKERPRGL